MRHVILGNGPAGVIAAEALRRAAPGDRVTLVGDEPGPPYSRMAIPYLLMGEIDEAGTRLRKDEGHFEQLGIEQVNDRATALDAGARAVRLASGGRLAYDRLLIATGSRANRPPIPGAELPGVHPCWTLADARSILALAAPGKRVLQLGAGFIGCIIMEALAARGAALTVVEMGERMVPRMMPFGAAELMRRWCEGKGIGVVLNTHATGIEPAGGALRVHLSDGTSRDCDLVIVATGVSPNVAFLAGSGIECDQGVLVNHRMATTVPNVYAAGDVAQAPEFGRSRCAVNAIQPVAAEQGRIAALNMAGRNMTSAGQMPMNILDTLGLVSASFGQWAGVPAEEGGEDVEASDAQRYRYLRLAFRGDLLVGATALGHTEHLGVIRGLIQGRVRLGSWKSRLVQDPSRLAEAYLACTRKAA